MLVDAAGEGLLREAVDYVPARMVNEYVYCPRLAYLEWVNGEWDDNLDTVVGRWVHRRVDAEPMTDVPSPGKAEEGVSVSARSVFLSSDRLMAIARIDLLEAEGRQATPVEYKKGSAPDIPAGAYAPERVQLCLQGLILRDNGYECHGGVLYFSASRTRLEVLFDETLIAETEAAVQATLSVAQAGVLPPPLVDSPKCVRCSLNAICLPDESRIWSGTSKAEVRRLVPARPDALPLYVQAQGTVIAKRDDAFVVTAADEGPVKVRAMDVSSVSVFGNVQVTTQALRAFCDKGIPLTLHSLGGWLIGMLNAGLGHKNVAVRIEQHRATADEQISLALAKRFIEGKLRNQRTLLRRNLETADEQRLGRLAQFTRQLAGASTREQLMGIEGAGARLYFEALPSVLRGAGAWAAARFAREGRNRRPPRDEMNAVLSFLYALLVRDAALASSVVGMDPYIGFLHAPQYGRPSMALDLVEEFRPLVADSVAITVFNQGEIASGDFVRRARGVALSPRGRRIVIGAYERRMAQTVTHPQFGYIVSYRRVMELQARYLRAVLLGEAGEYRAFVTR